MAFVDEGAEVILRADKTYRWQGLPNTTFTLELRDNNEKLVASLDRTGRIVSSSIPVVDTAGEGGFWGGVVHYPQEPQFDGAVTGVDEVRVIQFVLPFRVVVRNVSWRVTTLDVGGFVGSGIYDKDKNLLLQATISTTTTGVKSATITAVTLEPGVYWHAGTTDTGVAAERTINLDADYSDLGNAVVVRRGVAATTSTAGVLPATLGTITASGINPLATYFEP